MDGKCKKPGKSGPFSETQGWDIWIKKGVLSTPILLLEVWYKKCEKKKVYSPFQVPSDDTYKTCLCGYWYRVIPPLPFTYLSYWGLKKFAWFCVFPVHHPYWPRSVLLLWFCLATFLALQPAYTIQPHFILIVSVNIKSNPSTLTTDTACSFETSVFS
jgi:hypothetical protein